MDDSRSKWSRLTHSDLGMDVEDIQKSFAAHVEYTQGRDAYSVTPLDFFHSLARVARDRMLDRWNKTQQGYYRDDVKRVYYLSLEFLLGRLLKDGLINLGMLDTTRRALDDLDVDLDEVLEQEWDAGLGNGGLGRLAACFLDSMATLGLPAVGCGIRYEYGIFRQVVEGGGQVEAPDNWLRYGNPWEMPRRQSLFPVKFYGHVDVRPGPDGRDRFEWAGTEVVMAMAHDVPVPGYRNGVVNTLRLWSAKASREFDFHNFNRGDYIESVHEKNATENISRVLYPNDNISQGRELRLKQEYFFVSATLQDALRRHRKNHPTFDNLPDKAVFQLNDTHPAMAVAELMRLLLDEHGFEWEPAWEVTRRCFAYTNHTVLPEALETWRVDLFGHVLPRHLQIVYEINRRFLEDVRRRWPGDEARLQRMSLVQEEPERRLRMAHLAIVGSFSVNGVSALHSRLVRDSIFPDFAEMFPDRFNNKTNGITPRRWLLGCNPSLTELIASWTGAGWVTDLEKLREIEPLADDPVFRSGWREAHRRNKLRLLRVVRDQLHIEIDPDSIFDVQVKRIHEYKRQLMNVLQAYSHYRRLKRGDLRDAPPRTVFFGGKAAPGYDMAKRIIRLIHAVADVVNNDPDTRHRLKVVFIPDYRVSLAEIIIPAADLSEQISTAGLEASGTGNMKFALNGALTIGTLDGANVEILEAVGPENIFIFGLDEPGVASLRARGYDPWAPYAADEDLRAVIDALVSGELGPGTADDFRPIHDALMHRGDHFLVLADFAAYRDAQIRVGHAFHDVESWTRKSILNTARVGRFSSDRTIAQYAEEIWKIPVRSWREETGRGGTAG
jgi:starch phosphorylase